LRGRLEIHATVYRHSHDGKTRVWLTLDKAQIFNAADLSFQVAHNRLYEEIKEKQQLKPIPYSRNWEEMFNSPERAALVEASDNVEQFIGSVSSNFLPTRDRMCSYSFTIGILYN
jgi:hypothetical protein